MFDNVAKEAVSRVRDNIKLSILGQFVVLFGVVYILNGMISDDLLVFGVVVHSTLMLLRAFISYKYSKNKNKFLYLYFTIAVLSGIAWGSILFFIPELPIEYHLFIVTVFIGLVSGAIFTLGEILHIYLAYIIPILTIIVYWSFTQESTTIYTITAYLSMFAFFYYISAAKKYSSNYYQSLSQEKEKIILLKESKSKSDNFELLFELSAMGSVIIENGHFIQCNQKSVDMIGCSSKEELLQMTPGEISPQYQSDGRLSSEKAKDMMQIALDNGSNSFEWLHKKVDGKLFLADVTLSSIILNGKKVLYTSWRDITEEKKFKNNLKHLAHHDSLTNLPNRILFNDRLEQAIVKSNRSKSELAVFFIDLDKFKPINDSLGHEVGDEVLIEVSKLLRSSLRAEDTLARIGGDEFTIIMENFSRIKDVTMVAEKLLKSLNPPIRIDGHSLDLSLSIGISIYPGDADNSKELLKLADKAMYKAKDSGRDNYKFYKED